MIMFKIHNVYELLVTGIFFNIHYIHAFTIPIIQDYWKCYLKNMIALPIEEYMLKPNEKNI